MTQANAIHNEAVFRRLRNWTLGGLGAMGMSTLLHQMDMQPLATRAAVRALLDEGSIVEAGPCGRYYVTSVGIAKYEGAEAAARWKPVLESWGLT